MTRHEHTPDDLATLAHAYAGHARIEVDAAQGRQVLVVDGRLTGDWAPLEAIRRTPDEWCELRGLYVMDPDGWRGSSGRPWTDPITEGEFRLRLRTCTIRYDDVARAYFESAGDQ